MYTVMSRLSTHFDPGGFDCFNKLGGLMFVYAITIGNICVMYLDICSI